MKTLKKFASGDLEGKELAGWVVKFILTFMMTV